MAIVTVSSCWLERPSPSALGSQRARAGPGKASCPRPPPRGRASPSPPGLSLDCQVPAQTPRENSYLGHFVNHWFPHLRVREVHTVERVLGERAPCASGRPEGHPGALGARASGVRQGRGHRLCQTPATQEQWSVGTTGVPSATGWPWCCGGGVGLLVILLGAHRGGLLRWR